MIFRQRSFWILTFLMPLLLLAMNSYAILQDSGEVATGDEAVAEAGSAKTDIIGLVDEAGLIERIPPPIPADLFQPFELLEEARAALEEGQIEQVVQIPADYLEQGQVNVFAQDFQIRTTGQQMGVAFDGTNAAMLSYLLQVNLIGDENLALTLGNPLPGHLVEEHAVNPASAEMDEGSETLARVVASYTPYVFYFILLIGSSYLMRSVVSEKENRTVEVLLLSVNPRQVMIGKILAMSLVTMLQALVWAGGGWLALKQGAGAFNLPPFEFPPGFLLWFVPFLALGFLLFASFMAAAGAIAPSAREGNQMTWLLIIPLMPTLLFADRFVTDPHGALAVALSLFPFSAPSAMVTRLAVAPNVPLWQTLLSLAGLALTTYLFVNLSARFFQAGNLLSQASFSWRRLALGWREK